MNCRKLTRTARARLVGTNHSGRTFCGAIAVHSLPQSRFAPTNSKPVPFKEIFSSHFWITTSGHFSTPALLCALLELGIDRLLFSVDWPYVDNLPGMRWMETVPLSAEDREKMFNGNARKLLKL